MLLYNVTVIFLCPCFAFFECHQVAPLQTDRLCAAGFLIFSIRMHIWFCVWHVHLHLPFSALTLLVGRQEGYPAYKKTELWGAGEVICLERGADLHIAQLMPLALTVSCFSKIQLGFTFWYRPTWVCTSTSGKCVFSISDVMGSCCWYCIALQAILLILGLYLL